MKSYFGRIKIDCTQRKGCLRNLKKDAMPGCMDCPKAVTNIIDFDDKSLFEYKSPKEKTGARKKTT